MRNLLLAFVLALVVVVMPRSVHAQGTSDQLPDPISTRELGQWLDRFVRAAPEQWESIDRFHEEYKTEFATLRATDIEKYLKDTKAIQGGMPQKKAMEQWVNETRRLRTRIRNLDTKLFDQIQTILTDSQMSDFPRVRMARERASSRNPMGFAAFGMMPADLSELAADLDLSLEQWKSLDPVLIPYETQLTKRLVESLESTNTMMLDMMKALEERGFTEMTEEEMMADPEKMKAVMETVQKVFGEISRKGRESAFELAQINRRTQRTLSDTLGGEPGRKLRSDFVTRSYPQLGFQSDADRWLRGAMRLKAISDDQRSQLRTVLDTFHREDDKLVDSMMEEFDEEAKNRSPFDFNAGDAEEMQKKATERQEKRNSVSTTAVASGKAIIGEELAEKIARMLLPEGESEEDFLPEGGGAGAELAAEQADAEPGRAYSGDMFTPPAIDVATVSGWSRRLGLDAGQKAVLESLHADYLSAWKESVEPRISAINEAMSKVWTAENAEEGDNRDRNARIAVREAAVDSAYTARDTALVEVRRVDGAFLADVLAALATEEQDRVIALFSLQRALESTTGMLGWSGMQENKEHQVNVVKLVDEALGETPERAGADSILLANADDVQQTAAALHAAMIENQRTMEKLSARMQASRSEDDATGVTGLVEYRESMRASATKAREAADRQRAAVRKVLDEITATLSKEEAAELRRQYGKEAFPEVYTDRRSAAPLLKASRALGGLSDAQMVELDVIEAEYLEAYDGLSERMVEIQRDGAGSAVMGMDTDDWKGWQDRRERMERLRFERSELSAKTVRRLKSVLSEEQAKSVPGLGRYGQEEEERRFGF